MEIKLQYHTIVTDGNKTTVLYLQMETKLPFSTHSYRWKQNYSALPIVTDGNKTTVLYHSYRWKQSYSALSIVTDGN